MKSREYRRATNAIRNMMAQGWTEKALLIDHAAQVLGNDTDAKVMAERVWLDQFEITSAN